MDLALPWASPNRPELRLVRIETRILDALADGNLAAAAAEAAAGGDLAAAAIIAAPWLAEGGPRRTLGYRSVQIAVAPSDGDWTTRFVVDVSLARIVGLAGFHGPPDDAGRVEVGYQIADGYRRRGYARAALEAMLDVAARMPTVRIVRASIAPTNDASRGLVEPYGFAHVGEQWDDEDGLELLFERPS